MLACYQLWTYVCSVSVPMCLSVARQYSIKMAKLRIMLLMVHNSTGILENTLKYLDKIQMLVSYAKIDDF